MSFTPPEHEEGLRCHYDAGNYQLAVEAIIWRGYAESLPRTPSRPRSTATAPPSTGC
ncbi:putative membrane protein [Mycobacterium xenopi 4042]|uniref:Putative membrane protein n=1 Tax=Mycobacterium xenopi 4042 TaxID=1299334 RepID=X8CGQ9_MYCXE|nr:putative membrane protein [Mycobacterium xenopi 3993]EUA54460.1 putative membrane protein [Mycobacterium xenopi 4042]